MPHFDIICLANSGKLGGHCVAGLQMDGSGWVRPVSELEGGILWQSHYTLTSGKEAKNLDVIRVGVCRPQPARHQPENWLIDGTRWAAVAYPWDNTLRILRRGVVAGPELLVGPCDRIPFARFEKQPVPVSLALVAPDDLYLYPHQTFRGKAKARGRFSLGTAQNLVLYDLPITEPYWQDITIRQGPRTLRQSEGKFLITISLSEPFEGECYKLIAAIMPLPRYLAASVD
jgi:hypothetical protein